MSDTMIMSPQWNVPYVLLSVCIAVVTSFFALELARRFQRDAGPAARLLLGGVLGYGIWAMHFTGMLAFELPTSVGYQLPLTLLSGVLAVAFLMLASHFMFLGAPTVPRILGSGVIAGAGICLMHYLGMAALQVNAAASYRPLPFALSVLIAVGAASVAFFLFSRVMRSAFTVPQRLAVQLSAALVMGLATSGMHYTGMAAVQYASTGAAQQLTGTDPETLLYLVIGATMVVFVGASIAMMVAQEGGHPAGAASD